MTTHVIKKEHKTVRGITCHGLHIAHHILQEHCHNISHPLSCLLTQFHQQQHHPFSPSFHPLPTSFHSGPLASFAFYLILGVALWCKWSWMKWGEKWMKGLKEWEENEWCCCCWKTTKLLENLEARKAQGPDGISNWTLKVCSNQLLDKMWKVLGTLLTEVTVPLDWKKADLVPVYKSKRRNYSLSHRSVSLTSVVVKNVRG